MHVYLKNISNNRKCLRQIIKCINYPNRTIKTEAIRIIYSQSKTETYRILF